MSNLGESLETLNNGSGFEIFREQLETKLYVEAKNQGVQVVQLSPDIRNTDLAAVLRTWQMYRHGSKYATR